MEVRRHGGALGELTFKDPERRVSGVSCIFTTVQPCMDRAAWSHSFLPCFFLPRAQALAANPLCILLQGEARAAALRTMLTQGPFYVPWRPEGPMAV